MTQAAAPSPQGAFASALLDSRCPPPPGLRAHGGADVGARFAVHRNNVVASLVDVLADGFPVVHRLVGDQFFRAMAGEHVRNQPPRSPVMSDYGDGFADWLVGFEPARPLPYLADMARLERARVRACHAADATTLGADALQGLLGEPARLPFLRLRLHPSLSVQASAYAVVSLWAAHQHDDDDTIGRIELQQPEAAVVLRQGDEVLVLPVTPAAAALIERLRQGAMLGDALRDAADDVPAADLTPALGLLLQHGALAGATLAEDPR